MGRLLGQLDQFDATFWGISPREAMRMDPQQRWLLEVAWEALEDAGTPPSLLRGAPVGVFVGIASNDYAGLQMPNRDQSDMHTVSGCTLSIAANRISYLLDLRGPSVSVDTACSSSLVAVWNACHSIWSGCCASALAGGANAVIIPDATIGFSKASMLSPTGQCYAFDSRANGYVRGEGAGMVFIKPLDQALADRDRIYAVIRSAVTNQDGHTSSMTVPSVEGQASLLRQAYREAGIAMQEVAYVEAHGTGTPVGDPIEASALGSALGEGRRADEPCLIGSVKTNIGHLEAASGMAGLIKAALILYKDTIPPNRNFQQPSPNISFDRLGLRVVDQIQPLPHQNGRPPVVGVNSFGFGGANAHVVLQQIQSPAATPSVNGSACRLSLLPISARSSEALTARVQQHCRLLADPQINLDDVSYTAGARREHHEHRLAVVGRSADQMRGRLEAWLDQSETEGVISGRAKEEKPTPIFVYTGQGAQWWAMGRQLLQDEPVFREAVAEIDQLFQALSDWSLVTELTRGEEASNIDRTDIAQPAIFAVQVGLTALWNSWGIRPKKVVGHSVGEVAAAYVAGIYSLSDAVRVIFERSRLQHTRYGRGRMLAVGMSAEQARLAIEAEAGAVSLAVLNSPNLVTLAGDNEPLERIAKRLDDEGKFTRWVRVPYAFHTYQMDPIKDELTESLSALCPQSAQLPFISTVTGKQLNGESLDATYWWKNVRQPVLFAPAIAQLIKDGEDTFLEVGPHPALASSIQECLASEGREGFVLHSLKRDADDSRELLTNLAGLYVAGVAPDWEAISHPGGQVVSLPNYPWQRESYWLEAAESRNSRLAADTHPLLGQRIPAAQAMWQVDLHLRRFPYLNDHRFWDSAVVPAACFVEIGMAVGQALFPEQAQAVEELCIQKALFLSMDRQTVLQVVFDSESKVFSIYSSTAAKETWELHAYGRVVPSMPTAAEPVDLDELRQRLVDYFDHDLYYEELSESGYQFGENFQQLQNVWRVQGEGLGEIVVPDEIARDADGYRLHPAVLDACFHIFRGLNPALTTDDFFLPQSIGAVRLELEHTPRRLWTHGRLIASDGQSMTSDIDVYDDQGRTVVRILGLRLDRVEQNAVDSPAEECFYQFQFEPRCLEGGEVIGSCHFPEPAAIATAARTSIEEVYHERGLQQYFQRFAPAVDELSRQAVLNAWLELGWQPQVGKSFSTDELAGRLGVVKLYHRLVRAQLHELSSHGWLRSNAADEWEILKCPQHVDASQAWDALGEEYPHFATEVALHQQTGPRLAEVMSGVADSREVMFPDGSAELVEKFYVEGKDFPSIGQMIRRGLTRLLQDLPRDRVLRVLEIGAGTGSLTRQVLSLLPADQTQYLFTDVGSTFLSAAEKQFSDFPFVDFQIFDIEQDPSAQGLPSHGFDLILGSLVLHATSDLKTSLTNLQSCIACGGMLLFLEAFPHRPSWHNIFGLLEGWWRFSDMDLRQLTPTLSREQWLNLLPECGFVNPVSFGTSIDERESEQAFFCAQADADKEQFRAGNTHSSVQDCYVLFADRGGVGEAVNDQLVRCGHRVVQVAAGSEFRRVGENMFVVRSNAEEDYRRLFAEIGVGSGELAGIIHCWGLDGPSAKAMSLEELWRAQQTGVLSGLNLIRALSDAMPRRFWFVCRDLNRVLKDGRCEGLACAPLAGFLRVANNEFFTSPLSLIDLDGNADDKAVIRLLKEVTSDDVELEVAYRGGCRYVRRLKRVSLDDLPIRTRNAVGNDDCTLPYRLQITKPGILDNLSLNETPRRDPGPDEIEIRVRAGGINFRDVLKTLGTYPGNPIDKLWLGDDIAGTVERVGQNVQSLQLGDEVTGIAPYGFQAYATADPRMIFRKPPNLSFEQAATLSTVFLTAHYAMKHLARLQPGEKILIHAGTGGVGQAAIQIARHLDLEIFATAGTPEKRQLLKEMGVHHVMNSRTLEFAEQIHHVTNGSGVDAVLNCLAGDFIPKSLSVLAPYGRFLEIGKVDIYKNSKIGMEALRNNISYFVIDVAQLCQLKPDLAATLMQQLRGHFEAGDYQPLPLKVFPVTEAASAFRYMAQGKHVGKNVLSFEQPEVLIGPCTQEEHRFRADKTYLITGGAGGFGLELCKWLSRHGARHIVLLSRSGPRDDTAQQLIEELRADGINVVDLRGDVTRLQDITAALTHIQQELPPLKGVIHAAMLIDDDFIISQDESRFSAPLAPKMAGAWNLHTATAELELEHFISLSSFSSIVGIVRQANYNAGNYFLDVLAHYRQAQGLPALTISWGALLGAGFIERQQKTAEFMANVGFRAFSVDEATAVFGQAILLNAAHLGAARIDWKALAKVCPTVSGAKMFDSVAHASVAVGQSGSLQKRLEQASPDAWQELLEDSIATQLAGVFGVSAERIERDTPLTKIGLDSLMALELTVRLEREAGTKIPMSSLLGGTSVKDLAQTLLRLLDPAGTQTAAQETMSSKSDARIKSDRDVLSDQYSKVLPAAEAEMTSFDGAALAYLPEKFITVGGLTDIELVRMFGTEPFISHYYETSMGRIAIITLPFRSHGLFEKEAVRSSLTQAIELASRRGAHCISLTGLIPSLTDYGQLIATWLQDARDCPCLTTGHATTAVAVVRNLQQMLASVDRDFECETLAVLGLGSIGQSCLQLLLEVGPHPRELILCDVFDKQTQSREFAENLRERHGYRGPIQLAAAHDGAPREIYAADTILTAVSVPNVLDVRQLRPGTVIVDDSYPSAFQIDHAVDRLRERGDIFFSNAGMLRLPSPIHETVLVPGDAADELMRFGVSAFREEIVRDPCELTACVLSSLLTTPTGGDFPPTLGLAGLRDLVRHYHGLATLGITAARPQCDNYFVHAEAIEQFRHRFGGSTSYVSSE